MKTLCIYTAHFPYGVGEEFLETEIKYLVEKFEYVFIIPANILGKRRSLPKGVEVLFPSYEGYSAVKGIREIGRWGILCLKDFVRSQNKALFLSSLLRAAYKAKVLYTFLVDKKLLHQTLHYTYWFNEQSTLLSILTGEGKINGFISRAHGFDLYDERRQEGFIPFRKLQLKYVTKVFLISQNGVNYLTEKYPRYSSKYELSYLGIENHYPFKELNQKYVHFKIVSCSRVVDIKRIDLIVKSLSQIKDLSIQWVHFGDGPLLNYIKGLAEDMLPLNIKVKFKGHVDNQLILQYYKDKHVDCFINVSSSEGLPVTIMEAISYSIPVIATNVGGTAEIATTATGILLAEDCTPGEVSLAIRDVLNNKSRKEKFREGVYKFWNERFNAEKNYYEFAKKINEISL